MTDDEQPVPNAEFHYGYDVDNNEFILWRRGQRTPVARIPFADGLSMADTAQYVASEYRNRASGLNTGGTE